jgi:sensor histidine kinase YesM
MAFDIRSRLESIPVQLLAVFIICTFIGLFLSAITYGSDWDNLTINLGISYCIGFTSWFFESLLERLQWIKLFIMRVVISVTLGAVVGGYIGSEIFLSGMEHQINMDEQYTRIIILGLFFSGFAFYVIYSQISLYQRREQLANEQHKMALQHQLLTQSRLQNLQAQIEPHFLFNTLANIHSRIESSPKDARVMLEHLTQLLRSRLNSAGDQSSLAEEVSIVEHYLAIQSLRLGERLEYQISISNELNDIAIPPLLIQPLVENAITHGIEPMVEGGKVTIVVRTDQDMLIISVTDNGVGFGNSDRHGSGLALKNIKSRLETLYGNGASLDLTENSAGESEAIITIPLESQ